MSGFTNDNPAKPYTFLQWKGTDVCMDFNCKCGANCHFDGHFAYSVKCPHCKTVWEMPCYLFPREASEKTSEYDRTNPKELEPDEDHSDEIVDAEGITRFIAKLVT